MLHRLLLALVLCAAPARAGVVDRVVLVVDEDIVLESDLRIEAMLTGLDDSPSPFWTLQNGTAAQRLEDAAVVRALAEGVSLYEPTPFEVAARVDGLRGRLGQESAWQAFLTLSGLDDEAIVRLMRRRMIVERYLARNLPEDPLDTRVWLDACHALLDQVRARFRVRRIGLRGAR